MTLAPHPHHGPNPGPPAPVARTKGLAAMVPPALVAGTIGALTLALHLRDPHQEGSWGGCPFAAIGIWCPGCGGLRAVNDLTDLRVLDAASSNLLFVCTLPFAAYAFWRWSSGRWTGRRWQMSDRAMNLAAVAIMVALLVFAVLRNTPAGAWLAP